MVLWRLEKMLELNHVRKTYDSFSLDCSLRVEEGCVTALIGANGAGKSTTFKAIMNLIRPDSGEIRIFGKKSTEMKPEDREKIAVLFAEGGFNKTLSVSSVSKIMNALYPEFDKMWFEEKCKYFQLPVNQKIGSFSTGEKAKLKVLLSMSYGARLLILDEPTAGLDVIARDEILTLLREYMETEGRSILISSHISSDLEGFCDDVYMIDHGRIVLHEDTDTLLEQYGILRVSPAEYDALDKNFILRVKKENYGYSCLTRQKAFYLENYPKAAIEKGSIDEVIMLMAKGEAV